MIEHFERFEQLDRADDQIDSELHRNFKPGANSQDIPEFINQGTDQPGEWIEIGIRDIPIDKIDLSESHVQSKSDFTKVSYDEMKRGMEILDDEVRPAINNQGVGREYFEQLDQANPIDGNISRTKVYDVFYGEKISAIRVAKVGDHFEVENGFHRIHVAQELHMNSIPALVKAKVY